MPKFQGPHIPSIPAQQAQRIEQLTAQIKRLSGYLSDMEHRAEVAEAQRDMAIARGDELKRLLDKVQRVSVVGMDLRAEIQKARET